MGTQQGITGLFTGTCSRRWKKTKEEVFLTQSCKVWKVTAGSGEDRIQITQISWEQDGQATG